MRPRAIDEVPFIRLGQPGLDRPGRQESNGRHSSGVDTRECARIHRHGLGGAVIELLELEAENAALRQSIAELEARIVELEPGRASTPGTRRCPLDRRGTDRKVGVDRRRPYATERQPGLSSAAERIGHGRADLAHRVPVNLANRAAERGLRHRVDAVAVDDRRSIKSDVAVIHADLAGEAAYRRGDLCNRDELPDIDDLGPGQHQDWSRPATDASKPELSSSHSSVQASASVQRASTRSGCRW